MGGGQERNTIWPLWHSVLSQKYKNNQRAQGPPDPYTQMYTAICTESCNLTKYSKV